MTGQKGIRSTLLLEEELGGTTMCILINMPSSKMIHQTFPGIKITRLQERNSHYNENEVGMCLLFISSPRNKNYRN